MRPVFEVEGLRFAYPGAGAPALVEVDLEVAAGRHTIVLGPNGAGKSTLLRLLLGTERPSAGRVRLWGRPATDWGRREIARRIGVVSQEPPSRLPLTVREMVGMGRHPYLRPWSSPGARDRRAVEAALERTGLEGLGHRQVWRLSGGELQRAKLARALAQEPRVLVLDEPTAHLDLGHEMRIFELVGSLVAEGITAVSVTHNLQLAGRYADRLVLLHGGRVHAEGRPRHVLDRRTVEAVFGWPVRVVDMGEQGPQVVPLAGGTAGEAEGP